MKIAVLGATGPSGKCVVTQALEQNHIVRAIVRTPSKIADVKHENLTVVESNIFEIEQLKKEFAQVDAVISCLGSGLKPPWGEETLYSSSIKIITDAMKATEKKRLICMTSSGQFIDSQQEAGMMMKFFCKYVIGTALADMSRMEKYLNENCEALEYTVVRPTGLTNGKKVDEEPVVIENVHYDAKHGHRIPRANVADVMLRALNENKWVNKAIYITMP